ncbi:type IV secretion system protein [Tessaracoccus sp. OS52]|uniref:type IV secretion system protein n=1 Tax=Tessaracoccus sp. OS52 TaxID=2886691 RepID=UPI001D114BD8|nr:type IV secretion system protein [Tessaracoccus sp. OS52]MCC2592540.1 type IV secretion system protein [Tessaracoccus sp. OS52]
MPWDTVLDIFSDLAAAGGAIVTSLWISICMGVWGAGLWVFRVVLEVGEWLLTPPLSATNRDGSATSLTYAYSVTLWFALALALLLTVVHLIAAVIRRDAKSLGSLLLGAVQFLLVSTVAFGYAAAVVTAVAGINQALMREVLGITTMRDLEVPGFNIAETAVSAVVATVLLALGLVLWLAALSHIVVLLGRSVALVVLTATAPIAAAGLLYEPLKGWFWKTFRWFHAAALAPILMTLMLGIGIQIANSVALGQENDVQKAAAMAVPAVAMILVASWSPFALFRLLAFVDPGTTSGANFRAALQPSHSSSHRLGQLQDKLTEHATEKATGQASSAEATTATRTSNAQTSSISPSGAPGGAKPAAAPAATTGPAAAAPVAGAGGAGAGTAGAGGAGASGGARVPGGAAGVVAVGALAGATALVRAFKAAGAATTGIVADSASGMGSGDPSYPYDPAGDTRRPHHTSRRTPARHRSAVISQEHDNANDV